MFEFYTWDNTVYDGLTNQIEFTGIYHNVVPGFIIQYNANYVDYAALFSLELHSISDSVSGFLAKEESKNFTFSIKELLDIEESNAKNINPYQLALYGLLEDSPDNALSKILSLQMSPLDYNLIGRTIIRISDRYDNGLLAEDLEDELDESPSPLRRQVLYIKYRDRSGEKIIEYAGTPRQIIHYLANGLAFAEAIFEAPLDMTAVQNQFDIYDDDRLKPGDIFNSFWLANFSDVIALNPINLELVDSNNGPFYAILKSLLSTLGVVQNKAIDLINKFKIKNLGISNIDYWLKLLGTKIFKYSFFLDEYYEIVDVEYDIFYKLVSITLSDTSDFPNFALFWHDGELMQYRSIDRDTNRIYDIDRHIEGVRSSPPAIGDSIRIYGNVRLIETIDSLKNRFISLLAPKELENNIQTSLNSIIVDNDATIKVFDFHSPTHLIDYNHHWVSPKRDVGWFLGREGLPVIKNALATYTKNTKTLVVTDYGDYSLNDLRTGDHIYLRYNNIDYATGQIYSADIDSGTIIAVGKLTDELGVEIDSVTNKYCSVYSVGTETTKIRSDEENALEFFPQTLLGHKLETIGYFQDISQISSLIYETEDNKTASTLTGAISLDDTSQYYAPSNQARYNYTGKVKHYTYEPFQTNISDGQFPFYIIANNWKHNEELIKELVNRSKVAGTTPNYAFNQQVSLFKTTVVNENSPLFEFTSIYENE